MRRDVVARLVAAREAVLLTRLPDGAQLVWPGDALPPPLAAAAAAALAGETNRIVETAGERWFAHVHLPAPSLVIVGAVHIAQAMVPLARAVGLGVRVVDPRRGFLTPERFPDVERVEAWPDAAVLALGKRSAVAVLSHDPKIDDPALDAALRSEAFYVGALGSRRTQAARRERLAAMGHDGAALARIRGPIGLALGAMGPAEIALSVLAEIVAVRRGAALAARP